MVQLNPFSRVVVVFLHALQVSPGAEDNKQLSQTINLQMKVPPDQDNLDHLCQDTLLSTLRHLPLSAPQVNLDVVDQVPLNVVQNNLDVKEHLDQVRQEISDHLAQDYLRPHNLGTLGPQSQ